MLSADFLHLEKDVEMVNEHADIFHLDIMDGTFVPNISYGFPVVEAIARKARKPLDVHLMIVHPEKYVERFAKAGAAYISFHYEAVGEESTAVIAQIQALGVKAGVAINPDCPGQKFIPESIDRVKAVKAELARIGRPGVPVEIDGGIGPSNAASVVAAGASMLVAGSSVFKAEDPVQAIQAMRG